MLGRAISIVVFVSLSTFVVASYGHGIGKHGIDTTRQVTAGPEGLTAEAINTKRAGPHQ
jgi:hypothetical protein